MKKNKINKIKLWYLNKNIIINNNIIFNKISVEYKFIMNDINKLIEQILNKFNENIIIKTNL